MSARSRPGRDAAIALGIVLLALGAVFTVHNLLRERIADSRREARWQPLLTAFPAALRRRISLKPAAILTDSDTLGLRRPTPLYQAFAGGRPLAWLIPAIARDGYNGDIALYTAVDARGRILGVTVIDQRETPGIGDRVTRSHSNWLDGFNGHSLTDPTPGGWYVHGDGGRFDEMTGATVTSRAVTRAVRQSLVYFRMRPDHFGPNPAAAAGGTTP